MSPPINNSYVHLVNPTAPIHWQPAVVEPPQMNFEGKVPAIQFFSCLCIVLGVASVAMQIAALVLADDKSRPIDFIGYGIWAGCFYIIAGSLGVSAAAKRNRPLFIGAIVMSALSFVVSIIAASLSGIATAVYYCYNNYYVDHYSCSYSPYKELEWTLVAISILSTISVLTLLILTSKVVCYCCCCKNTNGVVLLTSMQQPYVLASTGQSVYFQPQTIQLLQQATQHQVILEQPIQPMNYSYPNTEVQSADIGKPPAYQY